MEVKEKPRARRLCTTCGGWGYTGSKKTVPCKICKTEGFIGVAVANPELWRPEKTVKTEVEKNKSESPVSPRRKRGTIRSRLNLPDKPEKKERLPYISFITRHVPNPFPGYRIIEGRYETNACDVGGCQGDIQDCSLGCLEKASCQKKCGTIDKCFVYVRGDKDSNDHKFCCPGCHK